MQKKYLFWLWRRRSDKKQKSNESFNTQEYDCLPLILNIDSMAEEEERIIYLDLDEISGEYILECPLVQEMLRKIRADKNHKHMVVAPKSDRYMRHSENAMALERVLEQEGAQLILAEGTNPKDRRDVQGKMSRRIDYVIAEYKKDDLTENMRKNKLTKLRRNVWCLGTHGLFHGYNQRPRLNMEDKADRPVLSDDKVRGMWQLVYKLIHIDDLSLSKVCDELFRLGYMTKEGHRWLPLGLSNALSNSAICGIVVCNQWDNDMYMKENKAGKYVKRTRPLAKNPVSDWIIVDFTKPPNNAEPLLTIEQLWEIHIDLERHKRGANGKTPKNKHLVKNTAKMQCGTCGGTIGVLSEYYACYNRSQPEHRLSMEGQQKCSDSYYVRAADLDEYIWDVTCNILTGSEQGIDCLVDVNTHLKKIASLRTDISRLENRIQANKEKLKNNYKAYLGDEVDRGTYLDVKKEYENIISKAQSDMSLKKSELEQVVISYNSINSLRGGRLKAIARMVLPEQKLHELSFEEKKQLLKILYQGFTFKLMPVSIEDASRHLPPGDNLAWHGYFFGKNMKMGTYVICEGFWHENELIQRLKTYFDNHGDSICNHEREQYNHITFLSELAGSVK